jgi:hypothetical protein
MIPTNLHESVGVKRRHSLRLAGQTIPGPILPLASVSLT